MFRSRKDKIFLLLIIMETALLSLVVYAPWLRFDYMQTVTRGLAKFTPPTVHLGDSITVGGRTFNNLRDINLASNGLQVYQIAAGLPGARAFSPDHIAVMAGTNDAFEGPIDVDRQRQIWRGLCKEPRLVITLATPTDDDVVNARIAQVNMIAKEECRGRPIIDLTRALAGRGGRIQPRYTLDGAHLSDAAQAIWRVELRKHGV